MMAGVSQLAGPMDDLPAVRRSIHDMVGNAGAGGLILSIAGYPNRTIDQTRFVVDCCRELGARPA